MDDTEREAARLLSPLRGAEPEGPPGVSIKRAIRGGRRRRRRRTLLTGAATVLAVVVAVGLPAALMAGRQHDDSAAAQLQVGEFDVLTRVFTVGTAGGFTPDTYETGKYQQQAQLRLDRPPTGAAGHATVTLYAPGRLPPELGPAWEPAGRRAPDVYGREAFWLDSPVTGSGGTELAWHWADNAWAFAHIVADFPDLDDRTHRVAQSVTTGTATPVAVPFTVQPPAELGAIRAVGVRVPAGDSAERGVVLLGDRDTASAAEAGYVVAIGLRNDLPPPEWPTTGTVGGRTATVADDRVVVFDVAPSWSINTEAGPGVDPSRYVGSNGLVGLAGSLQLAADLADPTTWPTNPVR